MPSHLTYMYFQPVYTSTQFEPNSNWFDFTRSVNANRTEAASNSMILHLGTWLNRTNSIVIELTTV